MDRALESVPRSEMSTDKTLIVLIPTIAEMKTILSANRIYPFSGDEADYLAKLNCAERQYIGEAVRKTGYYNNVVIKSKSNSARYNVNKEERLLYVNQSKNSSPMWYIKNHDGSIEPIFYSKNLYDRQQETASFISSLNRIEQKWRYLQKSADNNQTKMWVTTARLNRRTCPSTQCGVVGQQFYRESVDVYEMRGKWARISKYYSANCSNGRSEYVESGNALCRESNGILGNKLAEWVSVNYLSEQRPINPAHRETGIAKLIANSDDYQQYRERFNEATEWLINKGICAKKDFEDGHWLKSMRHKSKPVYFAYCGGWNSENRVYLNAKTGKIYK